MKLLLPILALLSAYRVEAKAVFAHFMVGNVPSWGVDDWESDISLAQQAHIDAFALNIALGDTNVAQSISNAFQAAHNNGFQLFFSFDYAGGTGPWPMDTVISYMNQYSGSSAYFHYQDKPFVSTFEGPANAADWTTIKAQTGCFFMPDWSSLGAKKALEPGVADGLFSWAAWPWGNTNMNTYVDASYLQFLNGLPYMMSVAPWFYTNLPGYKKNWLWRGDDLWFDRWQEVLYVQPDLVEIVTWNDYGECHYIGPLHDVEYNLFTVGEAPYNYAANMPHDGWRMFLPFLIDTYKKGIASITEEGLVGWYRLQPKAACSSNGTSGNTASQFQIEFEPQDIIQDSIFFSALLTQAADVAVNVGGTDLGAAWTSTPYGGIGVYHGSVPYNGATGDVTITISRGGSSLAQISGQPISGSCTDGIENFNAWVGQASAGSVSPTSPPYTRAEQNCTAGTGAGNFAGLCEFACGYGYCPIGACYCTALGVPPPLPTPQYVDGYPANGDANYAGLCSFACNYGSCPSSACSTTQQPAYVPTTSPFNPLACTAGSGEGDLAGLCSFSCNYGYCPINACTCTGQGALVDLPAYNGTVGVAGPGLDPLIYGPLCAFACDYGYCPEGTCSSGGGSTSSVCTAGTGQDNLAGLCSFSCNYGYCPENACTCTSTGTQVPPPAYTNTPGYPAAGQDPSLYSDLCNFTCTHGYCPDGACTYDQSDSSVSDVVYIDPSIWGSGSDDTATCEAPCILVLPPYPLGSTTTLTWPVLTTTLLSSGTSGIVTITTTINVPSFTITDISLQPITLQPTDTLTYTINPEQSITPSSFIYTLPANEATFPPTHIPTASGGSNPTPSSTTAAAGVTFHPTPIPIIIQPEPTSSVPVSNSPPKVTVKPGPAGPTCKGSGCGTRDCGTFGCSGGCGRFACDGGCSIHGCGGGCGTHGCSGTCPLDICGGLGCATPGSCGGAAGGGDNGDDDNSCSSSITASACTYYVSSFSTSPMTTWSTTTTSTSCQTSTVCNGGDSSTTETAEACSTGNISSDYDSAFAAIATTVDGTAYPENLYPTPYPSATDSASTPYFGFSLSSSTSSCTGCYWLDGNEVLCTEVDGCTKVTTSTITTTSTMPPTTITVTVSPSATADCAYWIYAGIAYEFEIYNINGWATDNGDSLHKQEDGCGALTSWSFSPGSGGAGAMAYFFLPFFIKAGCVERAIVSSGGPKLQCAYQGVSYKEKRAQAAQSASLQTPSSTPSYSYTSSFSSAPSYTPQTWDSGSVVTLTNTPVSESTMSYTTTTVIQNGTTVSFSRSAVPSSSLSQSTAPSTTSSQTSTTSSISSTMSQTSTV